MLKNKIGIEDELHKDNENVETAFDDDENEIIFPSVDPNEWMKEYDRVKTYINMEVFPNHLDVSQSTMLMNYKIKSSKNGKVPDSRKNIPKNLVDITAYDELIEKIANLNEFYD